MGRTQLSSREIGSIQRNDFDVSTAGQAVITKAIAASGITAASTGIDTGTGDVTLTNNLITGISGGQTIIGGTASGNNLTLSSTADATKGKILFGNSAYDEVNNRLGIGIASPGFTLDVEASVCNAFFRSSDASQYSEMRMDTTTGYALFNRIYGLTNVGTHAGVNRASGAAFMCSGLNMYFGSSAATDIPIYFGTTAIAYMLIQNTGLSVSGVISNSLAPIDNATIPAGNSGTSVRSFKVVSGKKLTIRSAGRFRIL